MTHMPNSWQLLTLGDVAHWTSGGTPSSKNSDFYDGEIPWVCIGDLNEGLVLETAKKITKSGLDSSSAKIMPKGTVMLAMYATSIGDTGMMETDMATNQAIACGVPITEIVDGKYLLYYLQSQKHEFFAAGRGGAQPNINQGIVKGWQIPVPPIAEQHKIVDLLEDHLSRLAAALDDVKQAKIKAAQFRRSLLEEACTGRAKVDGTQVVTELPTGWELKRLGNCLEKLDSGKLAERGWSPQCLSHPVQNDDSWGVLKTTAVQMGDYQPEYNKELPDSLAPKIGLEVNPGDFLVTTTGPRNRCGIVCHVKRTPRKLIFSGKILRFRANEDIVLANWLMFVLMSPDYQKTFDKLKVGTSDSSVSIGNQQIIDLKIPVPPIAAQHRIVEMLEDHLSRLEISVTIASEMEKQSIGLRRSLLQAAFTGQLTNEVVSV
jgi:type I restriction enzyme S subunit